MVRKNERGRRREVRVSPCSDFTYTLTTATLHVGIYLSRAQLQTGQPEGLMQYMYKPRSVYLSPLAAVIMCLSACLCVCHMLVLCQNG